MAIQANVIRKYIADNASECAAIAAVAKGERPLIAGWRRAMASGFGDSRLVDGDYVLILYPVGQEIADFMDGPRVVLGRGR